MLDKQMTKGKYYVAKSTLVAGINQYIMTLDIQKLEVFVNSADNYLQEYGHTAFISKSSEHTIVVLAGSKESDEPWFAVELNITK